MSNEIVNTTRDDAVERYVGMGYRPTEAKQKVEKDLRVTIKKESALRAYMNYYSFIIGMIFLLLVYLSFDSFLSDDQARERAIVKKFFRLARSGGGKVARAAIPKVIRRVERF